MPGYRQRAAKTIFRQIQEDQQVVVGQVETIESINAELETLNPDHDAWFEKAQQEADKLSDLFHAVLAKYKEVTGNNWFEVKAARDQKKKPESGG